MEVALSRLATPIVGAIAGTVELSLKVALISLEVWNYKTRKLQIIRVV